MDIFIIEDEPLAVQKLTRLVQEVAPETRIVGIADGIDSAVNWLKNNPNPDLLMMDIELCDGQSFEIFNLVEVKSPVIFTTSYDEYAIQAFRVNSIDYLLKPIKKEDLTRALTKFKTLKTNINVLDISKLVAELQKQNLSKEYRTRFLVKQGQRLIPVETKDIAYFYSEDSLTFFVTHERMKHLIDYALDEIEQMLDPKTFFRISRQFVLSASAVVQIHNYFNGKLKLDLQPNIDKEATVSRDRVADFKVWMGK